MSSSSDDYRMPKSGRQFGLYRTDIKVDDYIRMSRKKQIKMGLICAAVTSTITVCVVITVLLIYEYMIAVETSLAQKKRTRFNNTSNSSGDEPVADELHRSLFGFDQQSFERMPLQLNALQESNIDMSAEDQSHSITKQPESSRSFNGGETQPFTKFYLLRRKKTHPLNIIGHKAQTPHPFSSKVLGLNFENWFDTYRNLERLKNLRHVIKYLENTINAKFGDLNFSENVHPVESIAIPNMTGLENRVSPFEFMSNKPFHELLTSTETSVAKGAQNGTRKDLSQFVPPHPGDVNLLAESHLRFSPTKEKTGIKNIFSHKRSPLFRLKSDKINPTAKNTSSSHIPETSTINSIKNLLGNITFEFKLPNTNKKFIPVSDSTNSPAFKHPTYHFQPRQFEKLKPKKSKFPNEKRTIKAFQTTTRKRWQPNQTRLPSNSPYDTHYAKTIQIPIPIPIPKQEINLSTKSKAMSEATATILPEASESIKKTVQVQKSVSLEPNISLMIETVTNAIQPLLTTLTELKMTPDNSHINTIFDGFTVEPPSFSTNPPELLRFGHDDAKLAVQVNARQRSDSGLEESIFSHSENNDVNSHSKKENITKKEQDQITCIDMCHKKGVSLPAVAISTPGSVNEQQAEEHVVYITPRSTTEALQPSSIAGHSFVINGHYRSYSFLEKNNPNEHSNSNTKSNGDSHRDLKFQPSAIETKTLAPVAHRKYTQVIRKPAKNLDLVN